MARSASIRAVGYGLSLSPDFGFSAFAESRKISEIDLLPLRYPVLESRPDAAEEPRTILVNNQVRVFAHPNFDPMCKGNQEKLRALSPGEFHRGNEVAVCGDQDDHLRLALQRQAGDVDSNPHVNALLPNARHDVGGFDFDTWALLAQYLWLEMPTLVKQLTEA